MQKVRFSLAIVAVIITACFGKFSPAFAYSAQDGATEVNTGYGTSILYYSESDAFNLTKQGVELNTVESVVPFNPSLVEENGTPENDRQEEAVSGEFRKAAVMVNGRQEANCDSTIIFVLEEDDTVQLLGEQGDWSFVLFNGKEAFVRSKFLIEV